MRILRLLLPAACLASPLAAQTPSPGLEIGADVSYWQLNRGNATVAPATRPARSVRAAVLFPTRLPATLGFSAAYADENRTEPGLLAFSAELAQRFFPESADGLNLFIAGGAGMLRYYAGEQRQVIDECRPEIGCIYEGHSHDEEWHPTMSASLGADVGIVRDLLVQPTLAMIKPLPRRESSGSRDAMLRLGIGIAWRP